MEVKIFISLLFSILPFIQPAAQIRIKAVGDIMLGSVTPKKVLPPKGGNEFVESIKKYLDDADIVFGNLEGTFENQDLKPQKCSDEARNKGICYEFGMPDSLAKSLKEMGFTIINLDNNHSEDYGTEGYNHTMHLLNNLGIAFAPKKSFASLTIDGKKIAVAAFGFSGNSNSILKIYEDAIIIKRLKQLYDIVIASFHGGAEGKNAYAVPKDTEMFLGEARGNVYTFAHSVIDAGADLVIGHGPHVLRAIELYKNKLIAYSLGNFLTYGNVSISGLSGISIILNVTLDNKNGNFLRGNIIPTKQVGRGIPAFDESDRGINFIKQFSENDFPYSKIFFNSNGNIYPTSISNLNYMPTELIQLKLNFPEMMPVSLKEPRIPKVEE